MRTIQSLLLSIITVFSVNAQRHISIIDVHSHIVTGEYLEYLGNNDALMEDGYPLPTWDEKSHLAFMDSVGIDCSILTLPSPQPYFGDVKESRKMIRLVNEKMADVKRRNPNRFLWCAALPQPDVEASINEVIYALDSLGADGIKLATSVAGQYLGDSRYDPLMKVLDEHCAVVILHPVKPSPINKNVFTGGPIFVYEYPVETTRAVINMVAHNVMVRYPHIKIIVPHAGSFLPYAVPRLKGSYPLLVQQGLIESVDIDGNLSKLYYDLAGGPSLQTIKMLLSITTPDHLLYGSDYPFVPTAALERVIGRMENEISKDIEMGVYVENIFRNNALKLFDITP